MDVFERVFFATSRDAATLIGTLAGTLQRLLWSLVELIPPAIIATVLLTVLNRESAILNGLLPGFAPVPGFDGMALYRDGLVATVGALGLIVAIGTGHRQSAKSTFLSAMENARSEIGKSTVLDRGGLEASDEAVGEVMRAIRAVEKRPNRHNREWLETALYRAQRHGPATVLAELLRVANALDDDWLGVEMIRSTVSKALLFGFVCIGMQLTAVGATPVGGIVTMLLCAYTFSGILRLRTSL